MRIGSRVGVWTAVVVVVGIAVLVLTMAAGENDYWTIAWPGVLTGCGTLALAGVTFLVLHGDQHDRRIREDREHRAQASRVQVSEPFQHVNNQIELEGGGKGFYVGYVLTVRNRSDDTIGRGTHMVVVDPWEAKQGSIDDPVKEVPRLTSVDQDEHQISFKIGAAAVGSYRVLVWFSFMDSSGSWWLRDPDFRLIEITEQQADQLRQLAAIPSTWRDTLISVYDPAARAKTTT